MHEFIDMLQLRFPEMIIWATDSEILLSWPSNHRREYCLINATCLQDEEDTIRLVMKMKVKYPVDGVRNKLYLKSLAGIMSHLNVEVSFLPRCTIVISFKIDRENLDDFSGWYDSSETIESMLWYLISFLQTVCFTSHINYRLSSRTGTDSYRKLLPTRMAELTVCGMGGDCYRN